MEVSTIALDELNDWLVTNGSATDAVHVARRLLTIGQKKGWDRDPAALVDWLEELALDVARAWQTDDPEEPTAQSPNAGSIPTTALSDLVEDSTSRSVTTEDLRVASAVLGLAGGKRWTEQPHEMAHWLERLALEVRPPSC